MVAAANITPKDTVLEIGPGKGVLTEALLARAGHVIAVEKDEDLVPLLEARFLDALRSERLTLVRGDIRSFFMHDAHVLRGAYKAVANIPYYITGEILESLLSAPHQPSDAVLLVQKEVAERVIAKDGKESILSIAVKAYGEPRIVSKVSRRFFSPMPKVDSAVLHVTNISRNRFANVDERAFFALVKAAFAQKRKKVSSNLVSFMTKDAFAHFAHERGLSEAARAEELSVDDWFTLAKTLAHK